MARRALGGRDLDVRRVGAERALVRHRLELVVERRRRAVGVDVADVLGADARRRHRLRQAVAHPLALGVRRRDVVRVARRRVPAELAVDRRAARNRARRRFRAWLGRSEKLCGSRSHGRGWLVDRSRGTEAAQTAEAASDFMDFEFF